MDGLGEAERAQALFEKGPLSAVAAFFTVAFFFALWLLLREKDRRAQQLHDLALRIELVLAKFVQLEEAKRGRKRTPAKEDAAPDVEGNP